MNVVLACEVAKHLSNYIDDAIDESPNSVCTPIRLKLHLLWINTNTTILQHWWAKFVCWWLDHVSIIRNNYEAYEQSLFAPPQSIEIEGKYSIRFHYPRDDESGMVGHLPFVIVKPFRNHILHAITCGFAPLHATRLSLWVPVDQFLGESKSCEPTLAASSAKNSELIAQTA